MQRNLPIKGTREGLIVKISPTLDFPLLLRELVRRFEESPSFFRGATLVLDYSGRTLTPDEDEALDALLAHFQVQRKESSDDSAATEQNPPDTALEHARPTLQPEQEGRPASVAPSASQEDQRRAVLSPLDLALERVPPPEPPDWNQMASNRAAEQRQRELLEQQTQPTQPVHQAPEEREPRSTQVRGTGVPGAKSSPPSRSEIADALLVQRTLRSGQVIEHSSHIIIVGDVNSGAEIIAGGNVIVWGSLRGLVQAGYPDNDRAIVCALALAPLQLRIGTFVARPPEGGAPPHPQPEVATVKDGFIVVEKWTRTTRR